MKYIKKFNESIEEDIKGLVNNLLSDYLRKTKSYITYYSLKGDDNLITFSINSHRLILSNRYQISIYQLHHLYK